MITALLAQGRRVGVTANSHKVQEIRASGATVQPGLRLDLVDHRHRTRTSTEEAEKVVEICRGYLNGAEFTDREEKTSPLTAGDLRVVAPYNAQVTVTQRRVAVGVVLPRSWFPRTLD